MDYQTFRTPPRHLRPAPFWGINDRLMPEEAARQFRAFLDAGYSGAFFHARMGLISEYLGTEWFAAFQAALEAAKADDGYLWLYDEDCWPSGSVAGQVTAMRDEYRSTGLHAELLRPGERVAVQPDTAILAAYRIARDGAVLREFEQIPVEALDEVDGERLCFRRVYAPANFGCWGDRSVLNTLHPEATAHFLRLTHEAYARAAGADFGGRIPGIFTDEPSVHQLCYAMPNGFPWYDGLPARYREECGGDFWADIPYWHFDGPGGRAKRIRLNRLVLRQFYDAFTRPIGEWCAAHGLRFTGHYLFEEDFLSQLHAHHGGIMTHYRAMSMPGIDQIERGNHPHLLSIRQAASAARQLGRPGVLCEIFGAQGETATFADLKAIGDYNLVHGVTVFCPHHCWHGAWGRRKRDFPPNFNYQQAYFADLPAVNDYFTRLMAVLTRGVAEAPVLLLHPIEDAGAAHRLGVMGADGLILPEETDAVDAQFASFFRIVDTILIGGFGCDVGDEGYLADLGSVEDGVLRVGEMAYPVVVVPPARSWRPGTFHLLRDFQARGGTLLVIGDLSAEFDGEATDAWRALPAQRLPDDPDVLVQTLDTILSRRFSLRAPDGRPVPHAYLQHRRDVDVDIFFIANTDDDRAADFVLTWLDGPPPALARWDAVDGSRARIAFTGDAYSFSLPANGSLLLVTDADAPAAVTVSEGDPIAAPTEWAFTRSEENVLVLDQVAVTVAGEAWPALSTAEAVTRLNAHFGLTGVERYQPWTLARDDRYTGAGGKVAFRYRFTSEIASTSTALVFDGIAPETLSVNGVAVSLDGDAWHWDRALRTVPVTIGVGENTVDFTARYDRMTEFCPTCLIGDFAVRDDALIPEPAVITGAPWPEQGYPYYSGAMTYRATLAADGPVLLTLDHPDAVLVRVAVNGVTQTPLMWPPFTAMLPCVPGENVIELTVVSSRSNTWFFPRDAQGRPRLHPYGLGPVSFVAARQ